MEDPGLEFRQGQDNVLFSKTSRQALGPTQPPFKWGPGDISPEARG